MENCNDFVKGFGWDTGRESWKKVTHVFITKIQGESSSQNVQLVPQIGVKPVKLETLTVSPFIIFLRDGVSERKQTSLQEETGVH